MKNRILLILILLSSYLLFADGDFDLEYSLDYSFGGTVFPDQTNKETNWNDLLDLKTGISGQYGKMDSLWLTINFYNDSYEKSVRLENTGFCLKSANCCYGYVYDRNAGTGKYSRIYSNILNWKYYRQPAILSYISSGLFISRNAGTSAWKFIAGGNEFNSFCCALNWQSKSNDYLHELQLLAMGRDNYYQKAMLALNYEGYWQEKWLWLSAASSSQILVKHSDTEDITFQNIGFVEAIIPLCKWLETGVNCQGRWLENQEKEKQFTAFVGLLSDKHSFRVLFNQEYWYINNQMQCLSTVYWYQIQQKIKAGGIVKLYDASSGDDFYELGMQVSYRK